MYQICDHGKQDGEPCAKCAEIVRQQEAASPPCYHFQRLSGFGQIKRGDSIVMLDTDRKIKTVTVAEVLNSGTDKEEIITNRRKNHYFITAMYLEGKSWAKDVAIIRK